MALLPASYEVRYDPKMGRLLTRSALKTFWWEWLKYGNKLGLAYAVFAILIWGIVGFSYESSWPAGFWLAALLGYGSGFVQIVVIIIQSLDPREKDPNSGEVWTCEMTEKGWSYRGRNGVLTFIPWSLMRQKMDHPEAWLIDFGAHQTWVFRQPLRDAGLEDEFRNRMGKAPDLGAGDQTGGKPA